MWTLPTQLCCNKSIVNILGLFGKIEASQPIKITMCYGSGTVYIDRIYSGQTAPAILHMQQQAERRMQQGPGGRCVHVHSPYSSTFQREINVEMTWWPPYWKCDVKSKIRLIQSMRIYILELFSSRSDLKRRSLRHFWRASFQTTTRVILTWDQFLIRKVPIEVQEYNIGYRLY